MIRESETASTASSNSSSLSMVSFFASNVTLSLVKNVKKYAEVGYQRLMVALPSRVTSEDMLQFTKLIVTLCDKCQVCACALIDFCFLNFRKEPFFNFSVFLDFR